MVRITVRDNPQDLAGADPPGHFRRWKFTWDSGACVELLGEVWRTRPWRDDGPDGAEMFARMLAQRLGCNTPA